MLPIAVGAVVAAILATLLSAISLEGLLGWRRKRGGQKVRRGQKVVLISELRIRRCGSALEAFEGVGRTWEMYNFRQAQIDVQLTVVVARPYSRKAHISSTQDSSGDTGGGAWSPCGQPRSSKCGDRRGCGDMSDECIKHV